MENALAIWSPVVVAELQKNRSMAEDRIYPLDILCRSVEDLKIRVKESSVVLLGLSVEARLVADILFLLRDSSGEVQLFKREEVFTERVPLLDFNPVPPRNEKLDYRLRLIRINWEGELKGRELKVVCFIDYSVIVTREQVVRLREEQSGEMPGESYIDTLRKLEIQIASIQEENQELHRQIFYHIRNISSLKRGIKKAESHNAVLSREIGRYQQLVQELQEALQTKESLREGTSYAGSAGLNEPSLDQARLGSRIKKLFLNNQ
ncbi:hypothetical protein [Syntrophomonas palmitatica]|uniref:hypothetical protein n=1 Tax=Syntrophomonas palmitatica TaxID=402877 RepID=UPI0006D21AA4|nr:hypothetical protein [Syntrophomonas palmitatica]